MSNKVIHKDQPIRGYIPSVDGRKVRYVFSTADYDRENDRLLGPWDLAGFRASPVILFGHDYRSTPIGRCPSVSWDGESLSGIVEFAPADISPAAEEVFQLVKAGFLRACSVGFRPLDPPKTNQKGGNDYGRVELLEVSLVPVPAQPAALAKALRGSATSDDALIVRCCEISARLVVAAEESEEALRRELYRLSPTELEAFAGAIEEVF